MRRKSGDGDLLAMGTAFLLSLMLLDEEVFGRQIDDLTTLQPQAHYLSQIVLTVRTLLYRVPDHCIWRLRQMQRVTFMTLLPTRFLPAFLAQTSGLSYEPIRGGRQVAIVAVFLLTRLQGLYLLVQQRNLLLLQMIVLFQQVNVLLLVLNQCFLQARLFS